MQNPFHKTMPFFLDLKIRMRLLRARLANMSNLTKVGAIFLVPAMAVLTLMVATPESGTPFAVDQFVAEVRAAQEAELVRGAEAIYHTKRTITEGVDKPAYVAFATGATVTVPVRTDVVETWQHSDTALTNINSNATAFGFESFLSREHEGVLGLHHYGESATAVDGDRDAYDAAHDLASLYTAYTSLERPEIPLLPETATFASVDEAANTATFVATDTGLEIVYTVALDTKLVLAETIYVVTDSERYEMTRVTYTERTIIPAADFEAVFDPTVLAYTQIL